MENAQEKGRYSAPLKVLQYGKGCSVVAEISKIRAKDDFMVGANSNDLKSTTEELPKLYSRRLKQYVFFEFLFSALFGILIGVRVVGVLFRGVSIFFRVKKR